MRYQHWKLHRSLCCSSCVSVFPAFSFRLITDALFSISCKSLCCTTAVVSSQSVCALCFVVTIVFFHAFIGVWRKKSPSLSVSSWITWTKNVAITKFYIGLSVLGSRQKPTQFETIVKLTGNARLLLASMFFVSCTHHMLRDKWPDAARYQEIDNGRLL